MVRAKKTSAEAKGARGNVSGISAILRSLRTRAGMTLSQLAKESDVSMSTISKIESGQLSPGYDTILRLSLGLQVDVGELFHPNVRGVSTGRRGVTRSGDGIMLDTPRYLYEALAGDVSNKEFLPLLTTIKAGGTIDVLNMPAHEGEEFVFVLSGQVILYSELYEPLTLEAGDSVYFDSRAGHILASGAETDSQVLWICSHRDAMRVAQEGSGA